MTEVDAALVRRKLTAIVRNLDDLQAIEGLELDDYRADRFRLKGTERLLQETVEAAVDINVHLLRAAGGPVPGDYYDSFVQAGERGVIPEELGEALAPAAGLRNRLVHEYDAIDDAIVLDSVGEARRRFPRYVEAIEGYLERKGF